MAHYTRTLVDLSRFADQAADLEAGLRANPPAPGCILFYGSSTMVKWRDDGLLQRQMAPLPVLSTGFGGSTAEEALYYYTRLVLPARPSVLVYYEGDNDLASGYTPAEVIELSQRLFEWARHDLPGLRIVIIPVKESPARIGLLDSIRALNLLWLQYAADFADSEVVDIAPLTLDAAGQPRGGAIYEADQLHLNLRGYELLTDQVRQILEQRGVSALIV
ncbi:MAG: GDSL-type esterase/lipase family protein [Anaerolineae bacterium]